MSSQPFDSLESHTPVPTWAVLLTIGILLATTAITTVLVDATVPPAEPGRAAPIHAILRS